MRNDPLADALVMLKNAERAKKNQVTLTPASKLIGWVLEVMQKDGYIGGFEYVEDGKAGQYKVQLKGVINDCGVVKPRSSLKTSEFDQWESRILPARDFGSLILTTTAGVVDQYQAKELNIGGRVLAYVY